MSTPETPRTGFGFRAVDTRADHMGHRIVERTPDMAGRPVVICATCNVRLKENGHA